MAAATPLCSTKSFIRTPGVIRFSPNCTDSNPIWSPDAHTGKTLRFGAIKATSNNPSTKPNSILCAECDGNGAKKCSQCKGVGVNSEDLFNGQFKAGSLCWLCGGKKEVLCGNCSGAGFIGGFMNTFDE